MLDANNIAKVVHMTRKTRTGRGYRLSFPNGYTLSVVTCLSVARLGFVEVALFDADGAWVCPNHSVQHLTREELSQEIDRIGWL